MTWMSLKTGSIQLNLQMRTLHSWHHDCRDAGHWAENPREPTITSDLQNYETIGECCSKLLHLQWCSRKVTQRASQFLSLGRFPLSGHFPASCQWWAGVSELYGALKSEQYIKDEYSCPKFLTLDLCVNSRGCNYSYYLVSTSLRELELTPLMT